jgi:hypothetical protein
MRWITAASLGSLLAVLGGCLPDNPIVGDVEAGAETGAETGLASEGEERVETGLLGCPSAESCTIVALSQTIDDRVELFTGAGAGPRYRGALDLDLEPNPGGDISGEQLDEPYGLAWDGRDLHVLLGHYPNREQGSLLSVPAAALAGFAPGSLVAKGEWFSAEGVGFSTRLGVRLSPLARTEPLSLLVHPSSGALLIATFANDLLLPDSAWTVASELLTVDPAQLGPTPSVAVTALGCAGAWSLVALDEEVDALALACDGDEAVAIVDTSEASGPPALRCVADIPFSDKRVRYLAPDGLGGVIVTEHPQVVSASEDARIWWFDGACQLRGFSVLAGALSWELRELALIPRSPSALGPRWLLARADGDERGVLILAGDPVAGTVSPCGRISALDQAGAWTASGGVSPLRPHALALTSDGRGLAVGVGPATHANAGPGYGTLWWVELDEAEEACELAARATVELSAAAPAVDPGLPQTWRRAPDVVTIVEIMPESR